MHGKGAPAVHAYQIVVTPACGDAADLRRLVGAVGDDLVYQAGVVVQAPSEREVEGHLVNDTHSLQVRRKQLHVGYAFGHSLVCAQFGVRAEVVEHLTHAAAALHVAANAVRNLFGEALLEHLLPDVVPRRLVWLVHGGADGAYHATWDAGQREQAVKDLAVIELDGDAHLEGLEDLGDDALDLGVRDHRIIGS